MSIFSNKIVKISLSGVGLVAIVAAGIALGIGNRWAFGDGSSTMTT